MSYDLIVFAAPRQLTVSEALESWIEVCEDGASDDFPADRPRIDSFVSELLSRYPSLEDPADDPATSPWSFSPTAADDYVELNIQASRAAELIPVIVTLAADHRLSVYDGQEDRLDQPAQQPSDGSDD